jgi:high affinity sulfate transporter 1
MANESVPVTAQPQAAAAERARWVPALGWLRTYNSGVLRADVIAGLTLAAYLMPAGIADASLAGLPTQMGLYACLFSALVFWLFCSSRHTAITVTSGLSLLIGASLAPLANGDPARYAALASTLAILVAMMSFAAWLFRAGAVVAFISETILVGFKSGLALYLCSTQLPKFFGFKGTHGDFWERIAYFFQHIGDTNRVALTVGLSALALLIAGKIWLKNKPVAFVVIVLGIIATSAASLQDRGVSVLGEVPQGLPALTVPALSYHDVNELLPLAAACFLLGAVETMAIGRMFGAKHGYRIDSNQEFLALGGANLLAGLGQGYPVSGGMSQSLVNESSGARTPLSQLVAAGIMLVVILFLTNLLHDLPQPVLAAIVLMAAVGLFKLEALKRLWKFSRTEFIVAMAALLGVLGSGILRGVFIGAILSILLLLRRASRPVVAVLGRVPGTSHFGDISRNPENEIVPGVVVFRVDSALLYFNCDYIRDQVNALLAAQKAAVKLAVWCMATTPAVDLAGADLIDEMREELEKRGIALVLADARGQVRDALQAAGLEQHFGPIIANMAVSAAIEKWRTTAPAEVRAVS